MPCSWEGNRRSVVVLAMRHRLQWFIYLRPHSLRKGDKHPASSLGMAHFIFYLADDCLRNAHDVDVDCL